MGTTSSTASATAEAGMSAVVKRRIVMKLLWLMSTETCFGNRRSACDDDRQLVVGDERAVVGAAAQHVGARLAEADGDRLLAVGRDRRGGPLRRPRRVGAGARVLPRLHLRRVEAYFGARRLPVHEPGYVEPEVLA